MGACHAELVLADLFTALRADLGDNDLSTASSTVRVVLADGGPPDCGPPFITLSAPSRVPSHDAPLTEYHVVYECRWEAYVASTLDTPESRAFAVLRLASEACAAVQAGHANPALTALFTMTTVLMGWDDVFADEPSIPGFIPFCQGTIRMETDLARGA